MIRTNYCIVFFSGLWLVFLSSAQAQGTTEDYLSGNDIQHATNLAAIEKRLSQDGSNPLESLDKTERSWYSKFQEGGLLFNGWQEISEDVVAKVPDENKSNTKMTMYTLGVKIGCEWSKENDVRKISTAMLKDWGKEIRKTVANAPDKIAVVISSIESEVDNLLF
jgi:hypothetical protein